jgi:hypothetical protein
MAKPSKWRYKHHVWGLEDRLTLTEDAVRNRKILSQILGIRLENAKQVRAALNRYEDYRNKGYVS